MFETKDKEYLRTFSNTCSIDAMYRALGGKYTKIQIKNFCTNNSLEYKNLTKDERSQSAKNKVCNHQRQQTKINHDFFKEWSNNMAYILGYGVQMEIFIVGRETTNFP